MGTSSHSSVGLNKCFSELFLLRSVWEEKVPEIGERGALKEMKKMGKF